MKYHLSFLVSQVCVKMRKILDKESSVIFITFSQCEWAEYFPSITCRRIINLFLSTSDLRWDNQFYIRHFPFFSNTKNESYKKYSESFLITKTNQESKVFADFCTCLDRPSIAYKFLEFTLTVEHMQNSIWMDRPSCRE